MARDYDEDMTNPEPTEEAAPQDLESISNQLEEARKKASENWDLFLRSRADSDNIQRRAVLDIEKARKESISDFARALMTVADSLEHGLAAAETENVKALREGMELTFKLLIETFEKFGIQYLNPVGEKFDPACHEAISAQPTSEIEPNKILVVVQKGFKLYDRVLRPARVIVSKKEG